MPFQWLVIGGADSGGILVRSGQDLKSGKVASRLSTGSLVKQLELRGERLHYGLVKGTGPAEGWVSLKVSGKELLEFAGHADDPEDEEAFDKWAVLGRALGPGEKPPPEAQLREESAQRILDLGTRPRPQQVLGLPSGAGSKSVRRAYHVLALLHHPDKGGDEAIFKAIADAYKALTESQDELGGWRDLESVALPPWQAHLDPGTKGVNRVLFDASGTPPWESRRLYTACWQEGTIKCWEVSPPFSNRQPRFVGQIVVGGFVNDLAVLSPFGLLTAQSAGMKPSAGESLRTWNLRTTPFRVAARATANAIADAEGKAALAGGSAKLGREIVAVAAEGAMVERSAEDGEEPDYDVATAIDEHGYLDKSTMVYLHYRGVRSISLWPGRSHGATPLFVATVSKDMLAVSKISMGGCSLEPAEWKREDPHTLTDTNVLKHESANILWSGDNNGLVKCWDVNASGRGTTMEFATGAAGWIAGLEVWPTAGVISVSHSSGLIFLDCRAGKVIQKMDKNCSVPSLASLGDHNMLFAAVGKDLMQYDTRRFADVDYKKMAVGCWSLDSPITALDCTESMKGHLLVAAGCQNGKVVVLDST